EVAEAGETGERLPARSHGQAQPRDLRKAPGDERGARVGAEAESVGDAGGDGHDVLHRATHLHADDVVVRVDPEVAAVKAVGEEPGGIRIFRGDGHGSGVAGGYLARKGR